MELLSLNGNKVYSFDEYASPDAGTRTRLSTNEYSSTNANACDKDCVRGRQKRRLYSASIRKKELGFNDVDHISCSSRQKNTVLVRPITALPTLNDSNEMSTKHGDKNCSHQREFTSKSGSFQTNIKQKNSDLSYLKEVAKSVTWVPTHSRSLIRERLKCHMKARRQHFGNENIIAFEPQRKDSNVITELPVEKHNGSAFIKFRQAVSCVRILIRLLGIIINISDIKTTRTAAEEQWYTLHNSREALALAFNKTLFVREKAFAKVPPWAVCIFNMDPGERTENDCRRIHALLRGLKSFDKFTERIQLYICRSFRYQRVEPGRVILRRGHVGFNFYFIYSGSVFVNMQDVNIEGKRFEKTETVLVRGDSFGELALLQDIRRTASITCREKCELLVVDKETFAKVCPSIFERELDEKKQFLSSLPLFISKLWTNEKLRTLCSEAQILEYKTNKVVATDNDEEEWLYICMEGKCQIIRRLALDRKYDNREKNKRTSTPQLSEEILDIIKTVNKIKQTTDDEKTSTDDEGEEDDEQSKERLLVSMLLEYRKDGKRRKKMKNVAKEEEPPKVETMSLKGPTTLTSLMAQDKKKNADTDFVYLNIATLLPNKIFDLYSIIYPERRSPNSTVILVSCGAKLLRIKKKIFFSLTTHDSMLHSKSIANKDRYPKDEQLLDACTEKSNWENYKNTVFRNVMTPIWQSRSQDTNVQMKTIHDQQRRTCKLLKTLRINAKKERSYQTKAEEEENELLKTFENNMEAIFLLHRNCKMPDIPEIQHNFVVGRRSSCSALSYRRASQQRANSIVVDSLDSLEQINAQIHTSISEV